MRNKYKLTILALLFLLKAAAQEPVEVDSTDKIIKLDEVVISANKFKVYKRSVVQRIDPISKKYISKVNAQNTGDLLQSTGNVFVQKSQQGGSSPVIRGFEASRILLVVDGVRMNNLIYRSGHLQNVITVDQNMLERVEVMYGPSSTVYGSDGLGGVVHMITKSAKVAGEGQDVLVSGNVFGRYSSANNEKTGHVDINLGYKRLAFLTSFTYSDFDHMKMGDEYLSKYPDFGRRSKYVTQINNSFVDSVVTNDDDRIQRNSGYQQWDFMQKVLFQQTEKISHTFNLQLSSSTNVPRYDRLQDVKNGTLRYAEWYYGPQKRDYLSYTFEAKSLNGFIDAMRFTASYQDIEESRQTREYRRYDRFDSRREHVKVAGFVLDNQKVFGNNELSFGIDVQLNSLKSVADRTNLITGAVSKLDTRYPDGDNTMNSLGFFAQHILKFKNNKWILNDGLRLQFNKLHSTIVDNSFLNLPVTEINQSPTAVTGNIGIVYLPTSSTRVSVGLSSGFRAPNIDDNSRIFESSTASQTVVIPNPNITPEYTYTADLNVSHTINRKIRLDAGVFYTLFKDALALAPFTLNGQDSIIYNGTKCGVVANQNVNTAHLYGINAAITADFTDHISFVTTINYTHGIYETDPKKQTSIYQQQPDGSYKLVKASVSSKPSDHVPPIFGKTSIQYHQSFFSGDFYAMYNGWKKLDMYNPDGEDNQQYATADGIPSWFTLNMKTNFQINKQLLLQAAVENILDRNYRYFASGFSAPGRNFVLALRASF